MNESLQERLEKLLVGVMAPPQVQIG